MKKGMSLLVCLFLITSAISAQKADGIVEQNEYEASGALGNGEYQFYYTIRGDSIDFAMRAKTRGWVAVGFDPVQVMEEADMIFGWVDDESGSSEIVDAYSTGVYGPHPRDEELGGRNDLLSAAAAQEGEWTTVEFSRRLETGDRYDKGIPKGPLDIIWAFGYEDDFDSMHSGAGSAGIDTIEGTAAEKRAGGLGLVLSHALSMSLAFLMMTAALLIARYGKKKKWWLKAHKILGITSAALTVIGLGLGIFMVAAKGQSHLRVPHAWIGLLAILAASAAPLLGRAIFSTKTKKQELRRFHRWTGRTALILMTLTILSGLFQAGIIAV